MRRSLLALILTMMLVGCSDDTSSPASDAGGVDARAPQSDGPPLAKDGPLPRADYKVPSAPCAASPQSLRSNFGACSKFVLKAQ